MFALYSAVPALSGARPAARTAAQLANTRTPPEPGLAGAVDVCVRDWRAVDVFVCDWQTGIAGFVDETEGGCRLLVGNFCPGHVERTRAMASCSARVTHSLYFCLTAIWRAT